MHNGDGQYAFVNTVPIRASRDIFGVLTNGCPYGWLKKGLCSSLIKTITLEPAGAAAAGTRAAVPRNSRREIMEASIQVLEPVIPRDYNTSHDRYLPMRRCAIASALSPGVFRFTYAMLRTNRNSQWNRH